MRSHFGPAPGISAEDICETKAAVQVQERLREHLVPETRLNCNTISKDNKQICLWHLLCDLHLPLRGSGISENTLKICSAVIP